METKVNYTELVQDIVREIPVTDGPACFHAECRFAENIGDAPVVCIEGVGRIAYPLCTEQAKTIISQADLAPFGKGIETIIDIAVRQTWQIEPSKVTIGPNFYSAQLPSILRTVRKHLGLFGLGDIEAHFYKLLLYEQGGHFKRHQDTEKEPGMFGSLLVQLPAEHTGGELEISHGQEQHRVCFADGSADGSFYTAFYADCEHTLHPVTSGYRLVLAFNLVHLETIADPSSAASATDHSTRLIRAAGASNAVDRINVPMKSAVESWCADKNAPQKLVFKLEHKYTRTNLSFAQLKGDDRRRVAMLQSLRDPATGEPLLQVYLLLLKKERSCESDDDFGYYRRRIIRRTVGHKGDSAELGEEIESHVSCCRWVGPSGRVRFDNLDVDFEIELLGMHKDDVFSKSPDFEDDSRAGYQGNYAGNQLVVTFTFLT